MAVRLVILALAAFVLQASFAAVALEPPAPNAPGVEAASPKPEKPPASVPPELLPLVIREGRISWRGLAPGMLLREVSSMLRAPLHTDRTMAQGCGGEALELTLDGVHVLLGFESHERSAMLHTLFVEVPGEVPGDPSEGELLRAVEAQVGPLRKTETGIRVAGNPEVAFDILAGRGVFVTLPVCLE